MFNVQLAHVVLTLLMLSSMQLLGQTIPEAVGGFRWPLNQEYAGTGSCTGQKFCNNGGYTFNANTYNAYGQSCGNVYHPGQDWNVPGVNGGCNSGCSVDECIPVYAVASGKVVYSNSTSWGGVVIEHNYNGTKWYSQYGHVKNISVSVNQIVAKGAQIAQIGRVGTDCAHLHFEIRESDHPNPTNGAFFCNDGLNNSSNVDNWYENPATFIPAKAAYGTTLISPANNYTTNNGSNLTFDWGDLAGAANYRIQISTNAAGFTESNGFSSGLVINVTTGTTSRFTTNLPAGKYYWSVRGSTDYETSLYAPYRTITITSQGTATLTVSPSSRSVGNSSGNTTFSITSTTSWTATDNASWLTLSPTSGSGNATLTANYSANTGAARTATITVSGGGITRTATVTQAAGSATLTVSPSNRDVGNGSGGTTFSITSTTNWTATDNASWLTLSPTSGSGNATLTANYSANTGAARTATITVSGGGITRTVTVTQAAGSATLTVSPSNRDVGNGSGGTTFSITSTTSWTATDNASWLTLSPTSGSGNATLTANYSANTGAARTATITVSGGGITRTVTVSQTAAATATLTVTPSSRSVGNSSGNTTFSITSNTSWTATDNASWITLSPTSGSGNATLTANHSANTGSARTATITISGGGITRTVTVAQSAGSSSPPANDNPCGAINLPIVSTWSYTNGTNVGATTTTNPGPTTSCTFYGYDVWYSFVASSSTMTAQVGQTGTADDIMMALYSGSCSNLSGIVCDDDSGPGSMPKIVRSGLTVGTKYYIRVWGYNGQTGTFGIAVRAGANFNGDTSDSELGEGANPPKIENRITAYPNPTLGLVSLSNLSEKGWLRVTNLHGQQQKQLRVDATTVTIDLGDLPSGLYFITYFEGDYAETVKVQLVKE